MSFNPKFAKNLVFVSYKRFDKNVQIIIFAYFLLFQIRLKSLDYKYFVIFVVLLIKLTNIIIFEILSMGFLLNTRKSKFLNRDLRIGLTI